MNPHDATSTALDELIGQEVVIDLASPFVVLGMLIGQDHRYLIVANADVHDLRETTTTRELYTLESRRHGIRANRSRALVSRDNVVSIAALNDVVD